MLIDAFSSAFKQVSLRALYRPGALICKQAMRMQNVRAQLQLNTNEFPCIGSEHSLLGGLSQKKMYIFS